jgi:hypothetical protein
MPRIGGIEVISVISQEEAADAFSSHPLCTFRLSLWHVDVIIAVRRHYPGARCVRRVNILRIE